MNTWKCLLLVYRHIDVQISAGKRRRKRFTLELPEPEVQEALTSFRAFPALVENLSEDEAAVTIEIASIDAPLDSVTAEEGNWFWPSPDDTREALDTLAPDGRFDSIFVLWPQQNLATGESIPCAGWGLGMGPSEWSNGATYAVVANAPDWAWNIPVVGEVWLHEWLHGVSRVFEDRGIALPRHDADGGGSHGYIQSETTGWTSFYRDLMTGRVREGKKYKGITKEAWQDLAADMASHRAGRPKFSDVKDPWLESRA